MWSECDEASQKDLGDENIGGEGDWLFQKGKANGEKKTNTTATCQTYCD